MTAQLEGSNQDDMATTSSTFSAATITGPASPALAHQFTE